MEFIRKKQYKILSADCEAPFRAWPQKFCRACSTLILKIGEKKKKTFKRQLKIAFECSATRVAGLEQILIALLNSWK